MYTITVTTPTTTTTHTEWNYYGTVKTRMAAIVDLYMQGFYAPDLDQPLDDQWLVNIDGETVTVVTVKSQGEQPL